MTEDDVRTNVVCAWLAGSGYAAAEIAVEFGFEIKLGRTSYRVGSAFPAPSQGAEKVAGGIVKRPRADVLVTRGGRNLLVIEVKAPDEPLDDEARDQGISYARLLPEMAPFVVLTNGRETKIYDSITRARIDGDTIPSDHPNLRAGFRVSADELMLRAEAIELFVSLSPANLLTFCEKQVNFRMSRLRSDDPFTGKKYVPSLYIERQRTKDALLDLLDRQKKKVVVVIGRPQVGKTNFVCHFIEERLKSGCPCLFYPATSLQSGMLQEVTEDFGWIIGDVSSAVVLVGKLGHVLRRSASPLTIFIDGWNELDATLAHKIDLECERLSQDRIQIVLSFSHSAATRLLIRLGDPTFIADETGIGKQGAGLIEVDPGAVSARHSWCAVAVEPYDQLERDSAYTRYAKYYQVVVPR